MNLMSGISAVGTFVRNSAGKLADAAISGVKEAASQGTHAAETTASTALGEIAKRVADNPDVNAAVNKLGMVASKPASRAIQPHIVIAAVGAVIAIAFIVYVARRK